ncbi:tetraspanin-10-like isoform X1 [Musa acuminata AAA Group]|uniref:tetraspanin-10-like isoform X1 n=1 Tax=Musa acuminata AAA Group TaxID=214697 RepID=UPI0031E43D0F
MSTGTSTFVIRWINFFSMILAIAVICFGIWMSIHHDECRKSLTLPVMGLGALILLVSLIGFLGAWKNVAVLLWVYLVMLCLILIAIMVFTVLANILYQQNNTLGKIIWFIITNNGSGHAVAGLRYKEYHLQDYSSWFFKQLNNTKNWRHLKSCLVKSEDCNSLPKKYKTLKEYKLAQLSPIEAGCCRPPSECGYPAVNASYYDLTYHPVSTNKDCKLYKNSRSIKCYDCDSCKAGVAQYMKTEWRVVAIFNLILFVVLECLKKSLSESKRPMISHIVHPVGKIVH